MNQADKQLWRGYRQELKINEEVIARIKANDESVLTEWNFDDFVEGLSVFEDESRLLRELIDELEAKDAYDEDEAFEERMELECERRALCYSQGLCYC